FCLSFGPILAFLPVHGAQKIHDPQPKKLNFVANPIPGLLWGRGRMLCEPRRPPSGQTSQSQIQLASQRDQRQSPPRRFLQIALIKTMDQFESDQQSRDEIKDSLGLVMKTMIQRPI